MKVGVRGHIGIDFLALELAGRSARLARSLGARRTGQDQLVGVAVQFRGSQADRGSALVEATRDGWWYTAPVRPDRLVVIFMTDADPCRRHGYARSAVWQRELAGTRHVRRRTEGCEWLWGPRVASAATHLLDRAAAKGDWLAVGDAAIGVDPLSASGIHRALTTGAAAATAIACRLAGNPQPALGYERQLAEDFHRYRAERAAYYRMEQRWPQSVFWARRHEATVDVAGPTPA